MAYETSPLGVAQWRPTRAKFFMGICFIIADVTGVLKATLWVAPGLRARKAGTTGDSAEAGAPRPQVDISDLPTSEEPYSCLQTPFSAGKVDFTALIALPIHFFDRSVPCVVPIFPQTHS